MSKDSKIMGFHRIQNSKVHSNVFDLGRRNLFTAKIGQLLPIFCEEVIPGDDVKIDMTHFSRSMPIQTAAFTRLKENIQFFYVPYTALWSFYREAMQNMTKGQNGQNISRRASGLSQSVNLSTQLPYFSSKHLLNWLRAAANNTSSPSNDVGGSYALRVAESARLFQALGYGNFTSYSKLMRKNEKVSNSTLQLDGKDVTISSEDSVAGVAVSPFRLLAYHKIANDFYRYDKWQEYNASACNVDYLPQDAPSMDSYFSSTLFNDWLSDANQKDSFLFDMEYSKLPMDRFNGGIPSSQFGDESVVNLGATASGTISTTTQQVAAIHNGLSIDGNQGSYLATLAKDENNATLQNNTTSAFSTNAGAENSIHGISLYNVQGRLQVPEDNKVDVVTSVSLDGGSSDNAVLSILALRRATALQRYKEIQECNDADFCSQIEAHFGVKPNSHGSKAVFIGGYSSVFDINPQINQNLAGDNVANIQAAPTSNGTGKCHFKVGDDYGVIIGIYRITPQLDYANVGLDSRVLMTDAADYPIPELDSIGMDTYKINDLHSIDAPLSGDSDLHGLNTSYGYVPRYLNWKLSFDRFSGAFLSTLKTWVTGQDAERLGIITASAPIGGSSPLTTPWLLDCPPSLCDNIFVNQNHDGIDNDQFMIGSFIGCSVRRKLSVYGLPYSN